MWDNLVDRDVLFVIPQRSAFSGLGSIKFARKASPLNGVHGTVNIRTSYSG